MPSLAMRLARLLLLLLIGVRAEAERLVLPALPTPLGAKEALYGSISPDGRSFVYEVVEGDERLLWKLDLESLHAQRLTSEPGVRYHPVWAPDGKHLAYWRSHPFSRGEDGSEGLYVLDADARTERRLVTSVDDEAGLSGKVTWLSDGRILYRHLLERPNLSGMELRAELIAIQPDGSPARRTSALFHGSKYDAIAPSGTKAASIDSCCGGGQQSIWVRSSSSARCVAGPILPAYSESPVVWTRDEKRLYLIARAVGGPDSLEHAFAIDVERARAWRVGPVDLAVASLSVSDVGDVALTMMPVHGRVGSLWIIHASLIRDPEPGAQRLRHCPRLDSQIDDFVRSAKLPTVHWIEPRFEDEANHLTVFAVTYGEANDIYPVRMGLRYGSRIGWIAGAALFRSISTIDGMTRAAVPFPLRSSDAYLLSDTLAKSFQHLYDVDEFWRNFLIGNTKTPFHVIIREVRRDPHRFALVALDNPTVKSDTIPFDKRLELAVLEDTLAMAMVSLPSVRNDPERLARIADLPMYRTGGQAAERVVDQLQRLMPSLAANAQTLSERASLHAYMALSMDTDSLRSQFLRRLSPTRGRTALALETMRSRSPRSSDVAFARRVLSQLGTTPERELLDAIRRVQAGELPGSLPRFMLSEELHLPWRVLEVISRLDERFAPARDRATLELAAAPSTPDSVLYVLWEGLSRHRDPALAERLLDKAMADGSRTLLGALTKLDSSWYGTVVQHAREQLTKLEPDDTPHHVLHRPALLPSEPRAAPDTLAPGAWMRGDQCLAPDDWSEQLRRTIGTDARLLAGNWLCVRAAEALDIAFEMPVRYDSAYVFSDAHNYVIAFPPTRPDLDVTLVQFDTAFAERSRRVVRVH